MKRVAQHIMALLSLLSVACYFLGVLMPSTSLVSQVMLEQPLFARKWTTAGMTSMHIITHDGASSHDGHHTHIIESDVSNRTRRDGIAHSSLSDALSSLVASSSSDVNIRGGTRSQAARALLMHQSVGESPLPVEESRVIRGLMEREDETPIDKLPNIEATPGPEHTDNVEDQAVTSDDSVKCEHDGGKSFHERLTAQQIMEAGLETIYWKASKAGSRPWNTLSSYQHIIRWGAYSCSTCCELSLPFCRKNSSASSQNASSRVCLNQLVASFPTCMRKGKVLPTAKTYSGMQRPHPGMNGTRLKAS